MSKYHCIEAKYKESAMSKYMCNEANYECNEANYECNKAVTSAMKQVTSAMKQNYECND